MQKGVRPPDSAAHSGLQGLQWRLALPAEDRNSGAKSVLTQVLCAPPRAPQGYGDWILDSGVWSAECGVRSAECGVWSRIKGTFHAFCSEVSLPGASPSPLPFRGREFRSGPPGGAPRPRASLRPGRGTRHQWCPAYPQPGHVAPAGGCIAPRRSSVELQSLQRQGKTWNKSAGVSGLLKAAARESSLHPVPAGSSRGRY